MPLIDAYNDNNDIYSGVSHHISKQTAAGADVLRSGYFEDVKCVSIYLYWRKETLVCMKPLM